MNFISFSTKRDIDDLKIFIHKNWEKNHIFTQSHDLLTFQHKYNNNYNFVISRNKDNNINGILGFIPTYQFDKNLKNEPIIWLAIWQVDEKISQPGLGVMLLKWLEKETNPKIIGTVGQNSDVNSLYKVLGYHVDIMNHYYYVNRNTSNFQIAKNVISNKTFKNVKNKSVVKNIKLSDINKSIFINIPEKSKTYIKNRYIKHPFYNYFLFGILTNNKISTILIARKIEVNNSACLRIVDMIGNYSTIGYIEEDLQKLVDYYSCEYIDCLNYGIPSKDFIKWGFVVKEKNSIIPEHFEPFVRKNKDIFFAYKSKISNYIIFKADCDQDRPNMIIAKDRTSI